MEPLAQITSLFGEHYSEDGLKTIHGICSIKEGIILDIDNNIMRRNLLNGNSSPNFRVHQDVPLQNIPCGSQVRLLELQSRPGLVDGLSNGLVELSDVR